MEKKTDILEKQREQRLTKIITAMQEAGPMESSSAMVLYSDFGQKETQAVIAAAAKIISESTDREKDVEDFAKLVKLFAEQ